MKAEKIWFVNDEICVLTTENKVGKMKLAWFKRLANASLPELEDFELWDGGSWIHWEKLNEDLSVEGFFTYQPKNEMKTI